MAKIVYNTSFGGFSLSIEAQARFKELTGFEFHDEVKRHDPALVQVVEELGERANGNYAYLGIFELPAGSRYRIEEYDGNETVCTPDDYTWETL